ncbi:MAG: nickel pincer cofactor biosynthesis protein LarC [Candidatus Omnitrophica bacterium]|nr:nickel pincer cofactor biosynthesis protein LarC [Candidatus Omnitrophota bacterium]MCM8790385.1 nickel pincer cofactor biosynthesis protein LarC [Candidatus Omnitrophota bacterium]
MKVAYFDCFSGISGDMAIAAFLDAGLDFDSLKAELKKLKISGYTLRASKTRRGSIVGTKFDCIVSEKAHSHRPVKDILNMIDRSNISGRAKEISKAVFANIAQAESKIHGCLKSDSVFLHELGELDSVIDIVGVGIAIDKLGIDEVYSSSITMGRTTARCRHGGLPIPGPASLELLKGAPVFISSIDAELVTPTGAAILKTLAEGFGSMPSMKILSIGYGAGSRHIDEMPNMLRVVIGETVPSFGRDRVLVVESNIDDMSPQHFDYLFEKLFKDGALDVYASAIQMKKTRPAFKLTVICDMRCLDRIADTIFRETTTTGLRFHEAGRYRLARKIRKANTRYGKVALKIAIGPGGIYKIAPEYDDCVRLARENNVPLSLVCEEARAAFRHEDE